MNKTLLMILDGWGINPQEKGNAIKAAQTPNLDSFSANNQSAILKTSGLDVGLPKGIMGNSEVGHMNIGAGRVVYQLNTMIDNMIETGEFYDNDNLNEAIDIALQRGSKLHLFSLLSDGNVHSNLSHLYAMLELCKRKNIRQVYLHAFMDGRDSLPHSGLGFMQEYLEKAEEMSIGKVATVSGRYYAMDRDKRWERIKLAYDAIVTGEGEKYDDPVAAIKDSYDKEITDEFIVPKVIEKDGRPVATIENRDVIVFLNYRADRTRQITSSLILPDFDEFATKHLPDMHFVSMSEYDVNYKEYLKVAFYAPKLTNIIGEVLGNNGVKQLRLAETEKYAHVTFFFNCGREEPFDMEDRVLIPSPKVASYDLQPEMSAYKVKETLIKALKKDDYNLIVVNFANCDMVGHTGVFDAVVKAVETVDECFGEVVPVAEQHGYNILVTADHGNAEKMIDENDNIFTAHSTNDVPIIVKLHNKTDFKLKNGRLADISPTILKLLEVKQPQEMKGECLID